MSPFEPATRAYAPLMAALHAASFETPWSEQAFQDLLNLPTTIGLVNETGFILCTVVADEAEILTLCVRPDCRRRGIASALLHEMETCLKNRNAHHFFLDVRVSNQPALDLYVKNGFSQVARRRGYYATAVGPEDALILKKEL